MLIEHLVEEGCLPGPRLSGQHSEHGAVQEPVFQNIQPRLVPSAQKEKFRIGQQGKGLRTELIVRFVHGQLTLMI